MTNSNRYLWGTAATSEEARSPTRSQGFGIGEKENAGESILFSGRAGFLLFVEAGRVFVDEEVLLLAEDRLEGTTTPRTIEGLIFGPPRKSTIQITELHFSPHLPARG
jgi:hypothetical protein